MLIMIKLKMSLNILGQSPLIPPTPLTSFNKENYQLLVPV